MRFKAQFGPKLPTGWRTHGWRSCADLNIIEIAGVPRWFRCQRCNALVTHGQLHEGGCGACGNRRLHGARMLTWVEIALLKMGYFPLDKRETAAVRPVFSRNGR